MDIEQANQTAVDNLMNARPILKSVATARDVIPGMKDNLFLHAGPPIEWERMSGPLRGAIIGAMLFEGIAKSEEEATSNGRGRRGRIRCLSPSRYSWTDGWRHVRFDESLCG